MTESKFDPFTGKGKVEVVGTTYGKAKRNLEEGEQLGVYERSYEIRRARESD